MITVLRIGHRRTRDQRVTTHVALVSRAFGASGILVAGEEDASLVKSVESVVKNWGGDFKINFVKNWVGELERRKKEGAAVVHLTMYGEKVEERIGQIRKSKDVVVIVGSQKVPPEAYRLADYNISVTSQPHSEIAALAIFLDRFFEGKEIDVKIDGKIKVIPSRFGKNVLSCDKREQV